MRQWFNRVRGCLALLLVFCCLFPNRVLDTYPMNISGEENTDEILPLSEGSVISYTMDTGTRPLRGIQPGISLQGGRFRTGVIRCSVFTEPGHIQVSDNNFALSGLTDNVQQQIAGGAAEDIAFQPFYMYIPFQNYEKCKGKITVEFTYESNAEMPEPFFKAGMQHIVPGLQSNDVKKEGTATAWDGKVMQGGLTGYYVYTHNTYPLVYDLRLLLCVFLASCIVYSKTEGRLANFGKGIQTGSGKPAGENREELS